MDLTRLVRSIDQMQIRIKKLEEAVGDLVPVSVSTEVPDLFSLRSDVDFKKVEIPVEYISGSPILSNLYSSGNKKLTKFSVGTWPDEKASTSAVVVHGAAHNVDGEPIELIRMKILPALINAGLPFSTVQVDPGESIPPLQQMKLVDSASSHIVLLSPGLPNFKEAIM